MKREFPLMITAAVGLFMILSFFVPHELCSVPADFLQQSAIIVVAFGYVLGGANALKLNAETVYKRNPGWIYKLVLVVALVSTVVIGVAEGPGFLDDGKRSRWIYDQLYSPMAATMFSM